MTTPQSKKFRSRPLLIVLGVLLGLIVSSCGSDTALAGLTADPLATFEPPGTELALADNQGEGTTLGKPTHARVVRIFRVLKRQEADTVLKAFVAYAESVGWVSFQSDSDSFRASKDLEAGPGRLHITVHPEDVRDPEGPLQLTVTLDYDLTVESN